MAKQNDWIDLSSALYWMQKTFPFSIYNKEGALKNALLTHEIPTRGKVSVFSAYQRIEKTITADTEFSVTANTIWSKWAYLDCPPRFEAVQIDRPSFEEWIKSNAIEYSAAEDAKVGPYRTLKSEDERKAVDLLAERLRTDHNMKRDDAWEICRTAFPKLSERGFINRVWPAARDVAGLEPTAPPGPKPKTNRPPKQNRRA